MSAFDSMHYQSQVATLEEGVERILLCNIDYEGSLDEVKSRWRDEAYKKIERVNLLPLKDEYDRYKRTVNGHLEQCTTTKELLSKLEQCLMTIDERFERQEEISNEVNKVFRKYNDSCRDAESTIDGCHTKNDSIKSKMQKAVALL